jgi:pyruvate,water dikinase
MLQDPKPAPIIGRGRALGEGTVCGVARFARSAADLAKLQPGEILLAEDIGPDWENRIALAACIIVNSSDATGRVDLLARKLGVPVVVGAVDDAGPSWSGAWLEVSCIDGVGVVRESLAPS